MISKKFAKRRKDSAVSPVIATILMVAITVVLAAVLYVMVSGFTHNPGTTQSVGMTESQTSTGNWTVTISSVSASNIPVANIQVVITGYTGSTAPTAGTIYTNTGGSTTGQYLAVGDYFVVTGAGGSGATVTLYNGNSQLGTVTL